LKAKDFLYSSSIVVVEPIPIKKIVTLKITVGTTTLINRILLEDIDA
jgi:hypothetical protein